MDPTTDSKLVPGAPTPAEKPQKLQKKKKTKSAAPNGDASEDIPHSEEPQTPAQQALHSPIIELIYKRTRNYAKKISRIRETLSKDPATLNEDQKRAIVSLPVLEGVCHELEDIRKAIEAVEATTSLQRAAAAKEAEVETERRIQEAKTAAQEEAHSRVTSLLSVLALPPAAEGTGALASLQSVLLSSAGEKSEKDEIVSVFLSGAGEWQGLPVSRYVELTTEPIPETIDTPVQESFPSSTTISEEQDHGLGGSFHFMQASELEESVTTLDSANDLNAAHLNGDEHHIPEELEAKPEVDEKLEPVEPAEVVPSEAYPVANGNSNGALDWAADDADGLEDLNELKETFRSGQATPVASHPAADVQQEQGDGFVPVGGEGRARGRGRGGFRGRGGQGEFRGSRGGRGFRGGERGTGGRGRGSERGERGRGGRGRGGSREPVTPAA